MNSPIRTGLIGFGLSGRVFHAPFLGTAADYELIAVASSQPDVVASLAPQAEVEGTAQALIARDDIELIVITAPNDQHFTLARAALEAGKHVLLEKPAVTRLEHMQTLANLAQQQARVLTVYQNRRYDGDFQYLQALVQDGTLGELRHLDTRFDRFRPEPRQRWREQPGEGSGIFWDLGPHILDQVLLLLGPPESVYANLRPLRAGSEVTDWFEVQLNYPDAVVVAGSTPYEAGDMRRFNARFERGSWQCWGLDPQEEALRAGQMPDHRLYPSEGRPQTAVLFNAEARTPIDVPAGEYRAFYGQLARAIRGDEPAPVTLTDAVALLHLLELCEQSSAEGQVVRWPAASNG